MTFREWFLIILFVGLCWELRDFGIRGRPLDRRGR